MADACLFVCLGNSFPVIFLLHPFNVCFVLVHTSSLKDHVAHYADRKTRCSCLCCLIRYSVSLWNSMEVYESVFDVFANGRGRVDPIHKTQQTHSHVLLIRYTLKILSLTSVQFNPFIFLFICSWIWQLTKFCSHACFSILPPWPNLMNKYKLW